MSVSPKQTHVLKLALSKAKQSMKSVFLFSFVVNILLLTSPLFMLQVYDRVLLSRSGSTLLGLFAVAVFLLVTLLFVEIVRNFLLNRISVRFGEALSQITFTEIMSKGSVSKPIHDLNTIRSFLNAPFILAIFDLPWLPLYLLLVYFLHPYLGHVGLFGAICLFTLAVANDRLTKLSSQKSNEFFSSANTFIEHSTQNKDTILGMGMLRALSVIWSQYQSAGMGYHIKASDLNAVLGSLAKVIRQIIQVSVLAVGGYLVITDFTTAGVMIATSIIIGRALAPIEQSIQGWRSLTKVRESYQSLELFLEDYEDLKQGVPLPVPTGHIKFQNVVALGGSGEMNSNAETRPKPVIKNMSFELKAGEALGVTGPSGSGKSTLAKLIMGVIQPISGTVRIDGAELNKSVQYQYSAYFGYLPQEVYLFDGTVAENIARFNEADPGRVVEAAQIAGAHELILSLPEAYETKVGPSGINLSGGQKQRLGLARALYGKPALVILDEPTSNLDNEGRIAFMVTAKRLKEQGTTLIVIAHQPSLFQSMDKLALVVDGQLQQFGPIKEVLGALTPKQTQAESKVDKGTNSAQKSVIRAAESTAKSKPVAKAKKTITLNSPSASIKQIKKL
ncbi:MAG: ATP-binding cassette subfamily C protein EexD [Oleiphilaceae bacterium]|jgi:ATP-binding cassette subfamily C protein EexD